MQINCKICLRNLHMCNFCSNFAGQDGEIQLLEDKYATEVIWV